jgi:hypothetical protein
LQFSDFTPSIFVIVSHLAIQHQSTQAYGAMIYERINLQHEQRHQCIARKNAGVVKKSTPNP